MARPELRVFSFGKYAADDQPYFAWAAGLVDSLSDVVSTVGSVAVAVVMVFEGYE